MVKRLDTTSLLDGLPCTGCFACYDNCPTNCISVITDANGFLIPNIDNQKCFNCYHCFNQCPSRNKGEKNDPLRGYVAFSQEEKLYERSSSGGVFATIAKYFLLDGGFVYGAAYIAKDQCVKHICITDENDVKLLQGSKYVQSLTAGIYKDVKSNLNAGKKILFSGTPCQIAALYSVIGKDRCKNLYTIEIICHGVSNNIFFKKSVSGYKHGSDYPIDIKFRIKTKHEKSAFALQLDYSNGKSKTIFANRDLYYRLYVDGKIYRESCYECEYATRHRIADITLGDCSTYKDYDFLNPNKALSTVIINTEQGQSLWELYQSKLITAPINMEKEIKHNAQLTHPSKRPDNLYKIYEDYKRLSVRQLRKKYVTISINDELKNLAKSILSLNSRNKIRSKIKALKKLRSSQTYEPKLKN